MKHLFILFLLCDIVSGYTSAQDFEFRFADYLTEANCPNDTTLITLRSSYFEFYHTTDDQEEGTVDSNFCPVLRYDSTGRVYLDPQSIDSDRPLFLTIQLDSFDLHLPPYTNIRLISGVFFPRDALTNSYFPGEKSSSYRLKYRFLDSLTGLSGSRVQEADFMGFYPFDTEGCFFTSRFEQQSVTQLTVIFRQSQGNYGSHQRILLSTATVSQDFQSRNRPARVAATKILVPDDSNLDTLDITDDGYRQIFPKHENEPFQFNRFYLPQHIDTVPGPMTISYKDVDIVPNPAKRKTIVTDLSPNNFRLRQPAFTALRGGLVAGSDTLRHHLVIKFTSLNSEPRDCNSYLIELPAPAEVTYEFHTGDLRFGNDEACFSFRSGSNMIVARKQELNYGANGTGMLLLEPESHLTVEAGATLTLNNTVSLRHGGGWDETFSHVYLEKGSHLEFGPGGGLQRDFSHPRSYLLVHLRGGTVDLSQLTDSERTLVRFAEEETETPPPAYAPQPDKLWITPNPIVNGALTFFLAPEEVARDIDYRILDPVGRVVISQQFSVAAGEQPVAASLPVNLAPGVYYLLLSSGETERFVIK